ncbi:MAG TPA: glutathione S-transferase family protein [Steroidobacteraceae bacterium]|nr:glutathione S-transferase family protein [Steroidobacteraceae bacterium]
MLELYHWEPNAACARVMICLAEKQLDYRSHYVDILALEQYRPEHLERNARGEVPVLVHEGRALTEASFICEYLDEVFDSRPLRPAHARGRWQLRVWQKEVDEALAPSVIELAWQRYRQPLLAGRPGEELRQHIEQIPVREKRDLWSRALCAADPEQLARARIRVGRALARIEAHLSSEPWLAGSDFSLADIAVYSYFNYLPALCADLLNEHATPRTVAWLRTLAARSAVRAALSRGRGEDPYAVAAPGPEQIRWG